MRRLGYTRYVAQGGDVGAAITDAMGRQAPEGLVGIHTNLFVPGLAGGDFPKNTDEERAAVEQGATFRATGIGASAARSYWENGQATARMAGQATPPVKVPVGFTQFPGEIVRTPRSWVEQAYPTLTYFNKVDKGGHFAAWEEPELFSEELREAFRSVR